MTVFSTINELLSILKDLNHKEVDRFLSQNSRSSVLQVDSDTLVEIKEKSIFLLGKNITERIFPASNMRNNSFIGIDHIKGFFDELKNSLVRLNHLGISYSCAGISNELLEIKELLQGTSFKLYEEPADSPNHRWFFIGNLESWEHPLFELVMTESKSPLCTKWIPHFQIDIDTELTTEGLEILTKKYLKDNFIAWKLNLPNYGVVLEMGELANINGTKIYLGLGTDKRPTKLHREEMLRLV